MTTAALVLAGIAAALHVFIWTMESITWKQPATWKRFGLASQADADTTAPMAYNQGYYNLFLAVITVIGIVLVVVAERNDAGWALVIAACGSMAAAALVLLSTGAGYARAAATQGTVPAIAVLCAVLAIA
jgi:putative membrane protein